MLKIVLSTVMFILLSSDVFAIEAAPRITDREIIEKLSALDAKIDRVDAKIDKEIANIRGDIKELRAEIKGLESGQLAIQQQVAELKEGQKEINNRIDTLIYAVLGCFIALIGFVIWDRRTALAPAIRKNKELEEEQDKMKKALKEYAHKEPRLAEILRSVGIM